MKKVFFAALFLGAFTTANAVELDEKKDCHEYACIEMGAFEDAYGDLLSAGDYDDIYEYYYTTC